MAYCKICGTRILKYCHSPTWLHYDMEKAKEKAGYIHEAVLKVTRRGPGPLTLDPS